jgi:hypothetical protein
MLRALKTVTFLYVPQEDRIAGAIMRDIRTRGRVG